MKRTDYDYDSRSWPVLETAFEYHNAPRGCYRLKGAAADLAEQVNILNRHTHTPSKGRRHD